LASIASSGATSSRPWERSSVHFPTDPQQQHAAGQSQADNGEELGGDQREEDAKRDGGADAPEDDLAALLQGHGGGGHADDDRVVAGQHKVNGDDLPEGHKLGPKIKVFHI
jgi:hypothetical protein